MTEYSHMPLVQGKQLDLARQLAAAGEMDNDTRGSANADNKMTCPAIQPNSSALKQEEDFSPPAVNTTPTVAEKAENIFTQKLPSGAVITEDLGNPQPFRITTWPDGSRLVDHYMDGITVFHSVDGSRVTTFDDGSTIRTFPSGKKVVSRPES